MLYATYGTLRSDSGSALALHDSHASKYLGTFTQTGLKAHDYSYYPIAVESDNPDDFLEIQVFDITSPDLEQIIINYEGCYVLDRTLPEAKSNLFDRITITLDEMNDEECYIFVAGHQLRHAIRDMDSLPILTSWADKK